MEITLVSVFFGRKSVNEGQEQSQIDRQLSRFWTLLTDLFYKLVQR